MHLPLFFIRLAMILLIGVGIPCLAAPPRAWTVGDAILQAEYISSTKDTVTLRRADGQALRLNLAALSEADRTFVSQKQAEEKEANMVDAVLRGEIVWRLPYYSSLSWSSNQPAEIFLWDEQNRKPGEKVASLKVLYVNNQRNRNQFEGAFKTEKPVHIPRNGRVVVKAMFDTVVNGKPRNLEELSVPMPLPPMTKGEIKLPAVRLTIAR